MSRNQGSRNPGSTDDVCSRAESRREQRGTFQAEPLATCRRLDLVKHQARSFLNQPLCCFHDDERFARSGFARSLKSTGSEHLTYIHGHTDREVARNLLCGGRSYLRDATVDSVAHPATGALLQGVRPFLPHRPETRLVAGFFVSHHSIVSFRPRVTQPFYARRSQPNPFVQPDGPPAEQCLPRDLRARTRLPHAHHRAPAW
jgi:hypothetical protein